MNEPMKYSNILIAALTAAVAVCGMSVAHMNEKAKELSDAVLVQNERISQLERMAVINRYRLDKLDFYIEKPYSDQILK